MLPMTKCPLADRNYRFGQDLIIPVIKKISFQARKKNKAQYLALKKMA